MMKSNFAMFCKTYSEDLERFRILSKSFHEHNVDKISLYISVPEQDLELFKEFEINDNVFLISDESYAVEYMIKEKINNFSIGYFNQEICKLSFWETNLVENYLCIDSDVIFIRDFYVSDFMHDENTPYIVLVMDKDLSIEKHYQGFWKERQEKIKRIYDEIGLKDKRLRTCHGNTILNSRVLNSLKKDFMYNRNYTYKDLVAISPFEFTWYNAWFQRCKLVDEYAVEPFFKTFHTRIEYIFSKLKLIKLQDYSNAYVGLILNSNWDKPECEYKNPNFINKIIYKIIKKF